MAEMKRRKASNVALVFLMRLFSCWKKSIVQMIQKNCMVMGTLVDWNKDSDKAHTNKYKGGKHMRPYVNSEQMTEQLKSRTINVIDITN